MTSPPVEPTAGGGLPDARGGGPRGHRVPGAAGAGTPWLVVPRPRPEAPVRLVVFPHAGGGPVFYRGWADAAGGRAEVALVHYPGRESRFAEPPATDVRELAARIAGALRDTGDGRPTVFFGHSMGASVAYETAAALAAVPAGERGGAYPAALVASARRAPATCPPPDTPAPGPRSDEELLALVREHGATPMQLFDDPELREMLLRVLRHDYLLLDSCRSRSGPPVLDIPVTALWAREDSTVGEALIRPWRECTTGPFTMTAFDGGHFYLVEQRGRVLDAVLRGAGHGAVPPPAGSASTPPVPG